MNKGDMQGMSRSEKHNISIQTEFDMREGITIGATHFDPREGSFSPAPDTGSALRANYYCRSIYNPNSTEKTVKYHLLNVGGTMTAYISAGSYFHAYANIETIRGTGDGSDACDVELCYVDRAIGDDTGPREAA